MRPIAEQASCTAGVCREIAGLAEQQNAKTQARVVGIASIIWASSIFLSRVMGLIREQIIGRTLGASRTADLYFAELHVAGFPQLPAGGRRTIDRVHPNLPAGIWNAATTIAAGISFSAIANFIVVVGTLGIGLLMIFARPLATLVAPGFDHASELDTLGSADADHLARCNFFISSEACCRQHCRRKTCTSCRRWPRWFIRPGSSEVASLGAHYPELGAEGFAWGVLAGSIAGPFGLPLYGCLKSRIRWVPLFNFRNPDLRRYLWLSVPIMIGFSIVGVDEWIVKNQASYLGLAACRTCNMAGR